MWYASPNGKLCLTHTGWPRGSASWLRKHFLSVCMLVLFTSGAGLSKAPWHGTGSAFIHTPLRGEILRAVGTTARGKGGESQWEEAAPASSPGFQHYFRVGAEFHSQITEWCNMVPSWPSEELLSTDHFLCPTNTDLFSCVLSLTTTETWVAGWIWLLLPFCRQERETKRG